MADQLLSIILFLLTPLLFNAQPDSVLFNPEIPVADGIYLTFDDFRHNDAITREQIISKLDKSGLDFIARVLERPSFEYSTQGGTSVAEARNVWGYFQNGGLHINIKGDFYRIPVFGSISYFVAQVRVVVPGYYDPRFGYPMGSYTTTELREFLMNYYDGEVTDYSIERAEAMICRDGSLCAEFQYLKKRAQRDQIHRFIRRFNEAHPVYFIRR